MEQKINIVELLKDCPEGMKLDCLLYDNVTLISVDDKEHAIFPIKVRRSDGCQIVLTEYGQYAYMDDAKCIIFPKGKTTWEGFVPPCKFKDGDVAISDMGDIHLCRTENSSYCAYRIRLAGVYQLDRTLTTGVKLVRLATEEEKKTLFDSIKENGYKWNEETKSLEMLIEPKFKVGDRIRKKGDYIFGTVTEIDIDYFYKVVYDGGAVSYVNIEAQDDWELGPIKFDITTLKPFESRVLIRDHHIHKWSPAIWGYCDPDLQDYKYVLIGNVARCCIPYEGNEHLLGTTNDCIEYYKTW